jgi:hypothetical protein
MTDYCQLCGKPVGPGLGKLPGQCPIPGHGTHHAGACCEQLEARAAGEPEIRWHLDPTVASVAVCGGYEAQTWWTGPGTTMGWSVYEHPNGLDTIAQKGRPAR